VAPLCWVSVCLCSDRRHSFLVVELTFSRSLYSSDRFVVSFSSLFAKTWRINKIFHNPTMKRIKVTALDVMRPLFAFLAGKIMATNDIVACAVCSVLTLFRIVAVTTTKSEHCSSVSLDGAVSTRMEPRGNRL
jgi:hypothetical protein